MWQEKRRRKSDPICDQCIMLANWVQIEIPKIFLKTIQVDHNKIYFIIIFFSNFGAI
jgi:hypothetical protein